MISLKSIDWKGFINIPRNPIARKIESYQASKFSVLNYRPYREGGCMSVTKAVGHTRPSPGRDGFPVRSACQRHAAQHP